MTKPHYIPQGLSPIVPQLVIAGAQKALDFWQQALGAEVLHAMPGPKGSIMHAAVRIGEGTFFVSDATEFAKPTSSNTYLYVRDVDAVYERAIKAGATVLAPLTNMFWGDRWGMIADPFGNLWQLGTHVEDVSPEEMQRRMANLPA
ncbi:MAG TPA: glyoxalase/bleomycin resistance/extradiol dioxygenase family protein [Kofleriaceae bacterium]